MADINFFEPEHKKPEKSRLGMLLILVVIVLAGVSLAMLSISKLNEYAVVEKEKNEMANFIDNPANNEKLKEYYAVQADITRITNENMPITQAYADYKAQNTVTSSLIDSYVWAPIKANPDAIEFKSLSVAGNNLSIIVNVADVSDMRDYQWALAGMKVSVDKDYIDKLPGSGRAEGDLEINKFIDQFTSQIASINDPGSVMRYEGSLRIFINKNITPGMTKLLGRDR